MSLCAKPRYSVVQFDMDGTLIDSIPIIVESFQMAMEQIYGHREEDSDLLKRSIGLPLAESFAPYPEKDQDALCKAYIAANQYLQEQGIPLFDGIYAMLESLRQAGIRMAVVTSKREAPTLELVRDLELTDFFEAVVCKEMTGEHKPKPAPIYKAMELQHVDEAAKILFVGDSIHDLHCARNAGVDVAIVDWTRMDKDELKAASPTWWAHTPEELVRIICGEK